jgi:hypothetical protein
MSKGEPETQKYADITPELLKLLEGIDAKLTTILSLLADGKQPDEIDAGAILFRSAIDGIRNRK